MSQLEDLTEKAFSALRRGDKLTAGDLAVELEALGFTGAAAALRAAALELGKPAPAPEPAAAADPSPRASSDSSGKCARCDEPLNGVGKCSACELTEKETVFVNKAIDFLAGFGGKVKTAEGVARTVMTSDQVGEMGSEIGRAAKLAARLLIDPKGTVSDLRKEADRKAPELPAPSPVTLGDLLKGE